MHRSVINILNWYSLSLRKLCNNLRSYRFKRLEQKRIKMLVSKHEGLKKVFEPKTVKREYIFLKSRRPELRYNTPYFCVSSLYKFKVLEMSTH